MTRSQNQQGFAFPKNRRLLKRRQYLSVQKKPRKIHSADFLILLRKNDLPYSRFGFVVSKKVDKRAVVRNRIKRCLKETVRLHHREIPAPFDFVIIARKNAAGSSFYEIEEQILKSLQKALFLRKS